MTIDLVVEISPIEMANMVNALTEEENAALAEQTDDDV